MTIKAAEEPEFTIDGSNDDHHNAAPAATAPSMSQIDQETMTTSPPSSPPAAVAVEQPAPSAPYSTSNHYPTSTADPLSIAQAQRHIDRTSFGPTGYWRYELFSCFSMVFNSLFWMAWCCTPCLYGQLLQRLQLTACGARRRAPPGQTTGGGAEGTCMTVFVVTAVFYILWWFNFLWDIFWFAFLAYFWFLCIVARNTMRRDFAIEPHHAIPYCDGWLEDGLCGLCCSCCAGIQMARHTHDERRYPYNGCSQTGLPAWAPPLWDDLLEQQQQQQDGTMNMDGSNEGTFAGTGMGPTQRRSNDSQEVPMNMSNVEIV